MYDEQQTCVIVVDALVPENAVGAELVFRQVGARGCRVVALITMKSHAFVFIPKQKKIFGMTKR